MSDFTVNVYQSGDVLPPLEGSSFFHSAELFRLIESTPRQSPYMLVATDGEGKALAHMLAVVRHRSSWFPPYYYMHCRVLGEGEYVAEVDRDELFEAMLQELKKKLSKRVLYIEVSHLSNKMFGYRQLRKQRFFPVHWMSIHNSLHSRAPEERISERMQKRIAQAYQRGVTTTEVAGDDDFRDFISLLRKHNSLKPKRFIPHVDFFRTLHRKGYGRLFLTKYRGYTIGCSACIYSDNNAHLMVAAFRRKTLAFLHPDTMTVWHDIKDAYSRGYEHIFFMDVGLPFYKNPYREFILRFGGKPVSTYRWFWCSISWVNNLLSKLYSD